MRLNLKLVLLDFRLASGRAKGMPNRSSNRGKGKRDMNELAYNTVLIATGQD
jgi:hypothetical protein